MTARGECTQLAEQLTAKWRTHGVDWTDSTIVDPEGLYVPCEFCGAFPYTHCIDVDGRMVTYGPHVGTRASSSRKLRTEFAPKHGKVDWYKLVGALVQRYARAIDQQIANIYEPFEVMMVECGVCNAPPFEPCNQTGSLGGRLGHHQTRKMDFETYSDELEDLVNP